MSRVNISLLRSTQSKFIIFTSGVVVATCLFAINTANGEKIDNWKSDCANLLLISLRGSSQNKSNQYLDDPFGENLTRVEPATTNFFREFKYQLDRDYPHVKYKAQSVHDFPGLYDQYGYAAVPAYQIDFPKLDLNNAVQAEFYWWPGGNYRESVEHGVAEVSGYIKHQIALCPDQKIVMGGYSQGAQVAGESLFKLTAEERSHIGGVALFGDPNFVASTDNPINPFDKGRPYPWKRGTASNQDRGMLDARIPYVPADMERKVASWCFSDDYICAGTTGIKVRHLGSGHSRYPEFGARQAATEIIQRMAPELYAVERAGGGVNVGQNITQPTPTVANSKPIDFMFLVDSASVSGTDVFWTLRLRTPQVIPPLAGFFGNVRYGVADFHQPVIGGEYITTQIKTRQQPLAANTDAANLSFIFSQKLNDGNAFASNGDFENPHGLAIEKTALNTKWAPGANKHLVLITSAPYYKKQSYNICNSAFATSFGVPSSQFNCYGGPFSASFSQTEHSEICAGAIVILTKPSCVISTPPQTTNLTILRTIKESAQIAQATGVAVTIVVPHPTGASAYPGYKEETILKELEALAKSTGGLFLKYDSFTTAAYSDMMWRVLNHTPGTMTLAYQDVLDSATTTKAAVVKAQTTVPTVFDVSQGGVVADSYQWDFNGDGVIEETTSAPNTEHTYLLPAENFMTVAALSGGTQVAELTLPVQIVQYEGQAISSASPNLPLNIIARQLADGSVKFTWDAGSEDTIIFVGDAISHMPIASVPASAGQLTVPGLATNFETWAANDLAVSERQAVDIIPYSPPAPDPLPIVQPADPLPEGEIVDLPKLVVSGSEKNFPVTHSAPESQFRGERTNSPPTTAPAPAQSEAPVAAPVRVASAVRAQPVAVQPEQAQEQTVLAATDAKQPVVNPVTQSDVNQLVEEQRQQTGGIGSVIFVIAAVGTIAIFAVAYYFLKNR